MVPQEYPQASFSEGHINFSPSLPQVLSWTSHLSCCATFPLLNCFNCLKFLLIYISHEEHILTHCSCALIIYSPPVSSFEPQRVWPSLSCLIHIYVNICVTLYRYVKSRNYLRETKNEINMFHSETGLIPLYLQLYSLSCKFYNFVP